MSIQDAIREQVTGHPVVLYMKGTPQFPQCGFSDAAVRMLQSCGVDKFFSVNVLADAAVRQGIKEYSNWPTIPQLYVNGEFVGGCDIMREMHASGELQRLLGLKKRRRRRHKALDAAVVTLDRRMQRAPGLRCEVTTR